MDNFISAPTDIMPPRRGAERPEIDVPLPAETDPSPPRNQNKTIGHYNVAERIPRGRIGLLGGVAFGGVLIVATGLYAISPLSPFRHHVPTTTVQTVMLVNPPPRILVAPAAKLATMSTPVQTPVVWGPPAKGDLGQDLAAVLQMGGHAAPAAVILDDALPAPPARSPHRHATPFAAPLESAALPIGLPPAPPSAPAAPTPKQPAHPVDAAVQAAALQLDPMTPQQQLDVLQLVTQLGSLVRDQRVELQQMRASQQDLQGKVDTSVSDFDRRLTLAEARGAISAAMGGPSASTQGPVVTPASTASVRPARRKPTSLDMVPLPMSIPSANTSVHRYAIQAASPGLAMLSELDPSGGEEQQVPISPGDTLPGYGKVVSIAQRGSGWYVKTDHGIIQ